MIIVLSSKASAAGDISWLYTILSSVGTTLIQSICMIMYCCFSLPCSSLGTSGCPWLVSWSLCSCAISFTRCREEFAAIKTTCVLLTIWSPGEEPDAFRLTNKTTAFLQALNYIAQLVSKDAEVDNLWRNGYSLWLETRSLHRISPLAFEKRFYLW